MLRQDQLEQSRKLLSHLDSGTTAMADGVYLNPVTDYTCPKQLARERELFFRSGPLNIGLSCLLPAPGDYMTHDYAGVPLVLVRHEDGLLRGFLNVCRHRGAPRRRRDGGEHHRNRIAVRCDRQTPDPHVCNKRVCRGVVWHPHRRRDIEVDHP